jgi:threonine/homoserine/homoserine lactone efflux protein
LRASTLLFFSLFLPQFATAPAEEVPLQIAVLGGLLTITVMTVNLGVAWGVGSVRRAFNPSGRFDHVASSVLGLVFVGLALRMVFQEVRAR